MWRFSRLVVTHDWSTTTLLSVSLGERALQLWPLEPTQGGNKTRQTRTTQRQIGFSCLPTETLQDRNGIVTDAVNRKDGVGAAYNPGEQPRVLLHTTIVVQKFSLRLLNKARIRDVPRTPPDVQESSAAR